MRRRLLVLGATTMRSRAFATWQAMGLHVTLVDGHSTSRYEHQVDDSLMWDVRDGSADLDALVRLAESAHAVTTLADDSQLTVSHVAQAVGLPSIGATAAGLARSKSHQRAIYDAAGLPTVAWREVRGPDDLEAFFGSRSGPAVLKPVDATGGLGALAVDSLAEAQRLLRVVLSLSPASTAIVEDRLEGVEVCVEAVVSGGEVVFVSVTEAEHLDGPGFVCTWGKFGAHPEYDAEALEQARILVSALGLTDALVHAEYKVAGAGWTILETALRPGGGFVPEMTARSSGVNFYDAQARLALGEQVTPDNVRSEDAAAPYAQAQYLVATGTVRRVVPPAVVAEGLPWVRVVGQQVQPGQKLREPMSDGGRAGYVLGWGEDRDQLADQLDVAADRLCTGMGLTRVVGCRVPA